MYKVLLSKWQSMLKLTNGFQAKVKYRAASERTKQGLYLKRNTMS